MILRPYQLSLIDDIERAYERGVRAVLATAPTGAGKTVVFTDIARRTNECGTRTMIAVHRDTLLLQASRKLHECGVSHGIIAPGHHPTKDLVQVASVQTLVRRLNRHPFDFIVIDEAHRSTAATYRKILDYNPDAHVLGFTATPARTDGRGLDEVFQELVHGPGIRELIDDGYLVDSVVYGPGKKLDLSGIRTRMGDYDQKQLAEAMDVPSITGDAVAHYRKICPGVPAVIFCVSILHAEDVSADFSAAGFRSDWVSGKMRTSEIRRKVSGLGDGRLQVLASCDLVSEGFDAPAVGCAILLRPTKSLMVYIQQAGRALRPVYGAGAIGTREDRLASIAASDKPHAVILDHAGNCLAHGMPDEDREWTLEGRKHRSKSDVKNIPVRQCPNCFRCHRPAPVCPDCGHVYMVDPREVKEVDGELEKIDRVALSRARKREVSEAKTYEALKAIGRQRNYKPQWAWHMWNSR